MFIAAVPDTNRRKGLLSLHKRRKGTATYCGQDGLDYYLITIQTKRKKPDYSALFELYPRFSGRVIPAQALKLPDELTGLCYLSHNFERDIMLRLCGQISTFLPMPLIRRTIGLVDVDGIYAPFAETLIKYSPIVKVYTQNPAGYDEICRLLMERYGAPLVLTQQQNSLNDCALLFSPDGPVPQTQTITKSLVVMGTRPPREQTCPPNTLCLHTLSLTDAQAALVPGGIDPVQFFGAALELSGRRKFASMLPAQLVAGRRMIEAGELARHVQTFFLTGS